MTKKEIRALCPGMKVKIIDRLYERERRCDISGVSYDFVLGKMDRWLGQVVTVLDICDDGVGILIEEDADCGGMTRKGSDDKMHWRWKYNTIECVIDDTADPDFVVGNDDIFATLFV